MNLRLESYRVSALAFGSQTTFTDGTLTINTEEICSKERNGYMVANVARMLGAQCAIMTLEGTGNTWVHFMQSVHALEHAGIRTVQIVHELGGVEGKDWPIVDHTPEADAIVTGGGADRRVDKPTVKDFAELSEG